MGYMGILLEYTSKPYSIYFTHSLAALATTKAHGLLETDVRLSEIDAAF